MENNTTYSIKKSEINRKWYIIDAAGKPLEELLQKLQIIKRKTQTYLYS